MHDGVKAALLSGPPHSGKTSLLSRLVPLLKKRGMAVAGILAPGSWKNGVRAGFDLLDLATGRRTALARRKPVPVLPPELPYRFLDEGISAGLEALSPERCNKADIIIVDEIGYLELADKGWAPRLQALLALPRPIHLWVVQSELVEQVGKRWNLASPEVVTVDETGALGRLVRVCLR